MTDERYKQLMEQVGMPNSRSLLQALQQAVNETEIEYSKKLEGIQQLCRKLSLENKMLSDMLQDKENFG